MPGYDPVRLAERVAERVARTRGGVVERRYWRFRSSRHYGGNVAGDVVGCNLRCAFCWAWRYAHYTDVGQYYSPRRAALELTRAGPYRLARLTGGEPTIAWEHTRELARIMASRGYLFILETNGILIGSGDVDPETIPRGVYVRVSIKAPDPETYHKITGARPESHELQLRALERLLEAGLEPGRDFRASIVWGITPPEQYRGLIERLASIDSRIVETLEVEEIILYPHVRRLLERRRVRLYHYREP